MGRLFVTRPLFADDATGKFSRLGIFRRLPFGKFTVTSPKVTNPDPSTMPQSEREGFAQAVAEYAALPRSWVFVGGRYRYLADVTWPQFASDWYATNHGWAPPRTLHFSGSGIVKIKVSGSGSFSK